MDMEGILERSQQPSTFFTDRETEAQGGGRGHPGGLAGPEQESLDLQTRALWHRQGQRACVWPFSTHTDGALTTFRVPW